MKILHVCKKYPNALGGDAVVVSNLEEQQKLQGHHVTILTSNCADIKDGARIFKFGLLDTPAALDTITPKRLVSLGMLFFKVFKVLKTERPDVIHTHSVDMAFVISFAARWYKIPLLHTFHIVTFNDPQQAGIRSKTELLLLRGAQPRYITVLNPADSKAFEAAGFQHVEFVPNGVDIDFWKPPKADKKEEVFTFIAVGRLEEQKGFSYLIDAAASLKKSSQAFKLQIVGVGQLQAALQRRIHERDLDMVVHLLGYKSPKELRKLYAKAHVFVLSSLWEGMPLTLLEAWAAGLASIATDVSSIRYVADGCCRLVEPRSVRQLAKAMDELYTDAVSREKLAKTASNTAKGLSWRVVSERCEALYERCLVI